MTRNQIEYAKLKELERANRAQEALTQYRDTGTLNVRGSELTETQRHNSATESQALLDLGVKKKQATAQMLTAGANISNALANLRNAATNVRMSEINAQNAETNRLNYEVNARNASVQERLADVQKSKLDVDWYQAMTARSAVGVQGRMADAALQQAAVSAERAAIEERRIAEIETHDRNIEAIEQSRADSTRIATESDVGYKSSMVDLNSKKVEQIDTQISLDKQRNTRDWVKTGSDVINDTANTLIKASDTSRRWAETTVKLLGRSF